MKFTVSILCFNYGRYLNAAINSALSQELQHGDTLEIVVIDDGSTDETPQVCAGYGNKIRTVRSNNQGFASSLTKALKNAHGEYVFLLDADDYFAPGKLSQIRQHIANGALYIDHGQWFINESGEILPGEHSGGNTSTICVNRAAALPLLPIENEVALQTLFRSGHGVRLNAPLGFYRLHGSSMTNRARPGVQNDYLAGVHHRLAQSLHKLDPLPSWFSNKKQVTQIAWEYDAMGHYNNLEAALERDQRGLAYKACLKMIDAGFRSRTGITSLMVKMMVKTLLMRPSFPKKAAT